MSEKSTQSENEAKAEQAIKTLHELIADEKCGFVTEGREVTVLRVDDDLQVVMDESTQGGSYFRKQWTVKGDQVIGYGQESLDSRGEGDIEYRDEETFVHVGEAALPFAGSLQDSLALISSVDAEQQK